MAVSPEYKYTDRDVRSHPDLIALAVGYLEDYPGEFEYLLDAKRILTEVGSGALTVSQIRGVLNCMRHDPVVAGKLYEIAPPTTPKEDLDRHFTPRIRRLNEVMRCADVSPHSPHQVSNNKQCRGVSKYPVSMSAQVHARFCKASTGKLMHLVGDEAFVTWHYRPYTNELARVDLRVKVKCKYPSWIDRPVLFKEEPTIGEMLLMEVEFCPHCEKVEQDA